RPVFMAVGAALLLLLAVLMRAVWPGVPTAERSALRWLTIGAMAAAVPFAGAPIGSRCLVLPLLGGSAAIAAVLRQGWSSLRHQERTRSRLAGAGCILLAAIHLGVAPIQRLASPPVLRWLMNTRLVEAMQQVELDAERLASQRVVVLRAPDLVVGLHAFFYRQLYRLPMPGSWRTLSWARAEHRFTRTAGDTLELELIGGALAAAALRPGSSVELSGMRAVVRAVDDRGVTRVEFKFDRSLDDPALWFLGWRDGRLRRVEQPPVGGAISL
ncbi:MAG: hypothetical protein JXR83_02195, partial [Deltaproteobacteria bacterium]|nr:hypothetical protein [Deltaproteobacteria bacterium]